MLGMPCYTPVIPQRQVSLILSICKQACEPIWAWPAHHFRHASIPIASSPPSAGVTRKYYIRAEEVDWDYAPNGYVP